MKGLKSKNKKVLAGIIAGIVAMLVAFVVINTNFTSQIAKEIRVRRKLADGGEIYTITTSVTALNGVKGGTISGEGETPYESVVEGESSTKEIKITPYEMFEINSITINGSEYVFTPDADGSYTMPAFENMQESKAIDVKFSLQSRVMQINAVDAESSTVLKGVKYRITQAETSFEQEVATNESGVAYVTLPSSFASNPNFTLTQIQAPHAYKLNSTPTEIDVSTLDNKTYTSQIERDRDTIRKITTSVTETDQGEIGGVITVDDEENGTEEVKQWSNSAKTIKVTPNEFFEIDTITVNGENHEYHTFNSIYTFPVFEEVLEDKNIVVKFKLRDNVITIDTVDKDNHDKRLTSSNSRKVQYYIYQRDLRTAPSVSLSDFVDTSTGDSIVDFSSVSSDGIIGTMQDQENAKYGFALQDGKYIPTNSQSYRDGEDVWYYGRNSVARSVVEIDLSNKTGYYQIDLNATEDVVGEDNGTYTFAANITESLEDDTEYATDTTQMLYYKESSADRTLGYGFSYETHEISGTQTLIAGKKYYMHIYFSKSLKSYSAGLYHDSGDAVYIDSINVSKANTVKTKMMLKSNNGLTPKSRASGYLPIDLEGYSGKYTLSVNTTINSSDSLDSGYVTVSEGTDIDNLTNTQTLVSSNSYNGIATTTITGGKKYFVNFAYSKNNITSADDYMAIYKVSVDVNDEDTFKETVEADENGRIRLSVPYGSYRFNQLSTAYGYNKYTQYIYDIIEKGSDQAPHIYTVENELKSTGVSTIHYIYNTSIILEVGKTIEGKVFDEYETEISTTIPKNFTFNWRTDNYKGTMAENDITACYYYKLNEETVTDSIEETVTADKTVEENQVLVTEGNGVKYHIAYNYKVEDYISRAKVVVTKKLNQKIDEEKSNLAGGTYDSTKDTITWEEEIESIDTYENGAYEDTFEKDIELVFTTEDKNADITSETTGSFIAYWPKEYRGYAGNVKETYTETAQTTVKQDYRISKTVETKWNDNDNAGSKRPSSYKVQLKAGEETSVKDMNFDEVVLNSDGEYKTQYNDLYKYDEDSNEVEYSIEASEVNEDDLLYYTKDIIKKDDTFVVYYKTRGLNPITNVTTYAGSLDGTTLYNEDEPFNLLARYSLTLKEYIGNAKLTITHKTGPLDVEKSELNEGVYNEEDGTVTWTIDLGFVNTYKDGNISIPNTVIDYKAFFTELETAENCVRGMYYIPSETNLELSNAEDVKATETGFYFVVGTPRTVTVKYLEAGTNKVLAVEDILKGNINTQYNAQAKEIENYEIAEPLPRNSLSRFTWEPITVTWYYQPIGAIISAEKGVSNKNGKDYAEAGDTLEYRIAIINKGALGKDVVVKDILPEAVTFVDGSLVIEETKISDTGMSNTEKTITEYTAQDLADGITISMPKRNNTGESRAVIIFATKVDKTKAKNIDEIINVANVDGVDTNEEKIDYKKPDAEVSGEAKLTGTEKITSKDENIDYTITYNANISDYQGSAKITLVDNLPFEIDEEKSSLAGGTYNKEKKTITWEETIEGIDTYASKEDLIKKITKEISLKYNYPDDFTAANLSISNSIDTTAVLVEAEEKKFVTSDEFETKVELPTKVIVRYLESGTDMEVAEEDELVGKYGESYEATSKNIENYKLTNPKPSNAKGTYTDETIYVTFYYKFAGPAKISTSKEVMVEGGYEDAQPGDKLTYTIKATNEGGVDKNVSFKDTVPEGTTFVTGSIKVNGEQTDYTEEDLKAGIAVNVPGKEDDVNGEAVVTFEVLADKFKAGATVSEIKNTANVDGKDTNETSIKYKKPDVSVTNDSLTKTGDEKITSKDGNVYYEITYKANVDDFAGDATIKIVDTLPYGIIEHKSDLAGGTYDAENKTITWEEKIENIDTFSSKEEQEITKTKTISLKYSYPEGFEKEVQEVTNSTVATTKFSGSTKEYTKRASHTSEVQIPAKVIVHHYLFDSETNKGTETKLADDEIIEGTYGTTYVTHSSSEVPASYELVSETPDKYEGTMEKAETEVIYYYKAKEETVSSSITKTATANKTVTREREEMDVVNGEIVTNVTYETVPVLTEEDGVVTYNIRYNVKINDYMGKAKVTITDKLPARIDAEKSDIVGGEYDSSSKTITWEEEVEGIDTYANGNYDKTFSKTIKLVYDGQSLNEILGNTASGTVVTYYPDNHPTKAGRQKKSSTDTAISTVEQENKTSKTVKVVWEDNNNAKGSRPSQVKAQLLGNLQDKVKGEALESVILSDENNWTYTFDSLHKYDNAGREVEYSVKQSEVNAGDLSNYAEPEITGTDTIVVTNKYIMKETKISGEFKISTTNKITSSKDEVEYIMNYTGTITDYTGQGDLKITSTLPYKIDTEKSDLAGGIYDEETKTIVWRYDLGSINTKANGNFEVAKDLTLKVVYSDLDASKENMVNSIKAELELPDEGKKNTKTIEAKTEIDIKGKVIVRHVDNDSKAEIAETSEFEDKVGTAYSSNKETISGYTYKGSSGNERGRIVEGTTEVYYYYTKNSVVTPTPTPIEEPKQPVVENPGDPETPSPGTPSNPGNPSTPSNQYAKVVVSFIEAGTRNRIADDFIIEGKIGNSYQTIRQVIDHYKKAGEDPANASGTMKNSVTYVTYYYQRTPSGTVTVRYIDAETKKDIKRLDENGEETSYNYTIEGSEGEEYTAEKKDIPGYTYEEVITNNENGVLDEYNKKVVFVYRKAGTKVEEEKEETNELQEEKVTEEEETDSDFLRKLIIAIFGVAALFGAAGAAIAAYTINKNKKKSDE